MAEKGRRHCAHVRGAIGGYPNERKIGGASAKKRRKTLKGKGRCGAWEDLVRIMKREA